MLIFPKDVYTVDEMLPNSLRQWNGCMFQVIGIVVVIMYSTPQFGIVILPIGILYFIAQVYILILWQSALLLCLSRGFQLFSRTLSVIDSRYERFVFS